MHVVDEHELSRFVRDFVESSCENLGIVVLRLEVDPQHRTTVALGPLREQGGLAESRRGDECDDRAVCDAAEAVQQCGAHHGLTGGPARDGTSRRRPVRASQRFRDGHINRLQAKVRPAKGACRSRGCRRAIPVA